MNRRGFLTALLAVPLAGIKVNIPPKPGTWGAIVRSEVPFFRNVPLFPNGTIDKNTIYWVNHGFQFYVNNPRTSRIITDIGEG